MAKTTKLIVGLIVLLLMSSSVLAQNDLSNQTMPEISNLDRGVGVMLQLELRIDEMIEKAEMIIQEVKSRNNLNSTDESIIRLESYVESLNEIKLNLQFQREELNSNLNLSNQEGNFALNEMIEEVYVSIEELRLLVRDFRNTLTPLLNEDKKEEIKEVIEQRLEENRGENHIRDNLRKRIEQRKKQSILNKAQRFENKTGTEGVSFYAQQLVTGEISMEEFRQSVREFARENSGKNIKQRLEEENNQREEIKKRLEKRAGEIVENNEERRQEKIQQKIEMIRERVQNRNQDYENRRGEFTNQIRERIDSIENNVSSERIDDLTKNELMEIIINLTPEQKQAISQEIGIDIATVPVDMLDRVISEVGKEEVQKYINQVQLDVPVQITQQGRLTED